MRIGDQIQISGKQVTPLKQKSVSAKKQIEMIGYNNNNINASGSKGQIIGQKITEKSIQYLIKSDLYSSPKWEERDKLLFSYKNVIDKYERQQKTFLTSQAKETSPSTNIQQLQQVNQMNNVLNCDSSDDDKNKLNSKRKLCIGSKAPQGINTSNKKVCKESNKDGQLQQNKSDHKNNSTDKNHHSTNNNNNNNNFNKEKSASKNNNQDNIITAVSTSATENNNFYKNNNLFNTNNQMNNNNNQQQNTKISHRLLFQENDSQQQQQQNNIQINPKNVQKINDKQATRENQIQQQISNNNNGNENSKNYSDIENISYLNNSLSEEQKVDNHKKSKKPNNNNNNNNQSYKPSTPQNQISKIASTGAVFFKKDELSLSKKKSPSSLNNSPSNLIMNEISKDNNIHNNKVQKINSMPLINTTTSSSKQNHSGQKKKQSTHSDEEKTKINIQNLFDELSSKQQNNTKESNKPNSNNKTPMEIENNMNNNNKVNQQNIIVEEQESDDDIILKKKNFGQYLFNNFGFQKQMPKRQTIKNVYSPSKSPMIDQNKDNKNNLNVSSDDPSQIQQQQQKQQQQQQQQEQEQYQSQQNTQSQMQNQFVSPLKEVCQKNFERMNELIQKNSANKPSSLSNSLLDNDNIEHAIQQQYQYSQDQIENQMNLYEKEKADYSQFQRQLIHEYNSDNDNSQGNHNNNHDEDNNDKDDESECYTLQLEKPKQYKEQQQQNNNKFIFQGLQVEKQDNLLKVTLPPVNEVFQNINNNINSIYNSPSFNNEQSILDKQNISVDDQKNNTIQNNNNNNGLPTSFESNQYSTQPESFSLQQQIDMIKKQQQQKQQEYQQQQKQKQIKPLSDTGDFEQGDKAKKITACRPKENEILMDIEWETREDGKIPQKSTINSKIVREFDHNLLIDFYESKIKFTYKNSEKKKQNTSQNSLNTSNTNNNAPVKKEYESPNQSKQQ